MRDSDTYQAILDEGRVEEARKILLLVGRKRFGLPDATVQAAPEGITKPKHLERLSERLIDVSSWQELLATRPTRRRPSSRRKKSS